MKRWNHFHSLLTGTVFGAVALSQHPTVLALAATSIFLAGVVVGRFWAGLRHAAHSAALYVTSRQQLQDAKVATEKARATELRTRTRHRRSVKAEQLKELDRAYVRGATDQLHQLGQ